MMASWAIKARRNVGRMKALMSMACLSLAGSDSSERLRALMPGDTRVAANTDNTIIMTHINWKCCYTTDNRDHYPAWSATLACKSPMVRAMKVTFSCTRYLVN